MKGSATTPVVGIILLKGGAAVGSVSMRGRYRSDIGLLYISPNGDRLKFFEIAPQFTEAALSNMKYDQMDALVVAGEVDTLRSSPLHPRLVDLLQQFDICRKPVGGLMAGVEALGEAGLVIGKFVSVADDLMAKRMRNYGAVPLMKPIVAAGWIVTAGGCDNEKQFWKVFLERISDVET